MPGNISLIYTFFVALLILITQINVANSANYKSVNQKEKIEVIQKNIETIQDEISKTPNKKTIPIKIKDSTVKKYLANSTDYESFIANLKKSITYLSNKKHPKKSDIETISGFYMLIGENAAQNDKPQEALNNYTAAYNNLKKHNMDKDSELAFYSLTKILYLPQTASNKKYQDEIIKTIETTQLGVMPKYPSIYDYLSNYYKDKNDLKKSKYYANKFNSKQSCLIVAYDKQFIIKNSYECDLVIKALQSTTYEEKHLYSKQAINYFHKKKNLNKKEKQLFGLLLMSYADYAANTGHFNRAIFTYRTAYEYMKKNNLQKDFKPAAISLYKAYVLSSTVFNNTGEIPESLLLELEKVQELLPEEDRHLIYIELNKYYENKGNTQKAEYYQKLLKH